MTGQESLIHFALEGHVWVTGTRGGRVYHHHCLIMLFWGGGKRTTNIHKDTTMLSPTPQRGRSPPPRHLALAENKRVQMTSRFISVSSSSGFMLQRCREVAAAFRVRHFPRGRSDSKPPEPLGNPRERQSYRGLPRRRVGELWREGLAERGACMLGQNPPAPWIRPLPKW